MIPCLFECEIDSYCNNDNTTPLRKNVNVVATCLDSLFHLLIIGSVIFLLIDMNCAQKSEGDIPYKIIKENYTTCHVAELKSIHLEFFLFCDIFVTC